MILVVIFGRLFVSWSYRDIFVKESAFFSLSVWPRSCILLLMMLNSRWCADDLCLDIIIANWLLGLVGLQRLYRHGRGLGWKHVVVRLFLQILQIIGFNLPDRLQVVHPVYPGAQVGWVLVYIWRPRSNLGVWIELLLYSFIIGIRKIVGILASRRKLFILHLHVLFLDIFSQWRLWSWTLILIILILVNTASRPPRSITQPERTR